MAFEGRDFFQKFSKKGDYKFKFNVAAWEDENPITGSYPRYNVFWNEEAAYLIQRITTSGTLKIATYYFSNKTANYAADLAGRAGLSYVEYYQLFQQGG